MTQMFKLLGKEFKITMINILRTLMEKVDNMHKHAHNCDTVIYIKIYIFLFPISGTELLKPSRFLSDKNDKDEMGALLFI